MASRRRARLGEQLRRELSSAIRLRLRDPRVGAHVVTGVEVTEDLWLARVFVELHGPPGVRERTLAALRRAAPFLRSRLGAQLRIRRMPELRFLADESADAGRRIESILADVLPPGRDDPDEA